MYTWKINFKGKRTVGKANKGISTEKNNNRFLKIKKTEKEKKKEEERKKKVNFIEPQKPNVEAEVYNNNKKCD